MALIPLTDSAPAASADELREVESRFGFTFPAEMHDFFCRINGGVPKRPRFRSGKHEYVLNEFFPIKHGGPGLNLEDNLEAVRRSGVFPTHLIPFACDPGGDFFCFSSRPEDEGGIFLYRNDYFDDPQKAVRRIFINFEQLIAALSA
jgi:hypothetical protein